MEGDKMPLIPGSSKATIQKNIEEMIKSGMDPKRAEAAAYRNAGLSRVKPKSKTK